MGDSEYKKLKAIKVSLEILKALLIKEKEKILKNNPNLKKIEEAIKKGESLIIN